ncbi:SoxR reducing system RseC family protein [Treponema sp. OttesenSCG-928-L16]|nr:SoxR reducing system RseC family protein [Treponema sp. OttesenSCG-928-L16]
MSRKMMTGRISNIDGSLISIRTGRIEACFGCMNQECKSGPPLISAENTLQLPLAAGQLVEFETSAASVRRQLLNSLLPPILGFIGVYVSMGFLFPASSEAARAAAAVTALFIVSFGLYRLRRRFPPKSAPRVVRILEETSLPPGLCEEYSTAEKQ